MKKNRIRICGRKVIDRADAGDCAVDDHRAQQAGGSAVAACADSQATPSAIQATGAALHENTAWNIRNMMAARIIGPTTG